MLLVEQNVRAAVEIADRAYVLDDGKVVYEGDAREFGRDEKRVRELAGAERGKVGYGRPVAEVARSEIRRGMTSAGVGDGLRKLAHPA